MQSGNSSAAPLELSGIDLSAVSAFVLAGGRSQRMGTDKALLQIGGKALIEHALFLLQAVGLSATIAGGAPALASFAPLAPDAITDQGPLAGICSAMQRADSAWCVFATVDMPLAPPVLIRLLLATAMRAQAALAIASLSGFRYTFPVVLHRDLLPRLQEELRNQRRNCLNAFLAAADGLGRKVEIVPMESLDSALQQAHPLGLPPAAWMLNANTPADAALVESLLSGTPIAPAGDGNEASVK